MRSAGAGRSEAYFAFFGAAFFTVLAFATPFFGPQHAMRILLRSARRHAARTPEF